MIHENPYLQRINQVIDYIREHIDDDLSLHTLATVAHFSPFHFHRVFSSITGETVNQFVGRIRLERAASLLRAAPDMSILDAALACGFESASGFSKAFKKRFGISPGTWNRQSPLKDSKIGQVFESFPRYTLDMLQEVDERDEFEVRIQSLPAQRLAYIRVINAYQPNRVVDAYERLVNWYCSHNRDLSSTTLYGMSQDDPEITPLNLYRYDICLVVPDDWEGEGEVSIRDFPACQIASIHCKGDIYLIDRAYQYLFRYWLPRSRYQPDNLPGMEIYRQQPADLGWDTYDIDGAIPIVAL